MIECCRNIGDEAFAFSGELLETSVRDFTHPEYHHTILSTDVHILLITSGKIINAIVNACIRPNCLNIRQLIFLISTAGYGIISGMYFLREENSPRWLDR